MLSPFVCRVRKHGSATLSSPKSANDSTLHNLRATFATELSRQTNGNLLLVGEMLGHASLDTTRGYVRLGGSEQATEAVRRLYESAA
jgi:integrase